MTESHAGIIQTRDQGAASAPLRARWLFVDGATSFGGHEVMLSRWLEELAAQRTVDAFLLARSGQLQQQGSRHATVMALPDAKRFGLLRDARTFVRHVLNIKPEVIIVAEGCPLAQARFVALARILGAKVFVYVPLVQTATSLGFGSGRVRDAIVRRLYSNLPHGWITLTNEQANDFRGWSGVRRPVLTLPNTVARAIESARIEIEHQSQRRLRIVVLGRVEAHQKGLDTLLDHLLRHPGLGERMTLSFVGAGPFEEHIRERLANDPALAQWVSLQPWSPTLEVLQAHDVLLMTSRYEGVPLVMLEAMAVGIPVVASDLPGTRAFLRRECLFEPGNMPAAFGCIEQLASSAIRTQIARRNRAAFESQASSAAFAVAVRSLTQELRTLARASLERRTA